MEEADKRARDAAERSLHALQCEFLEFKTKVATELDRAAAEQVSLQARLVETAVALAEARARIDDLTTHQRLPARPGTPPEEQGVFNSIFYSKTKCSECENLKESEARWRQRAETLHRENSEIAQNFERKFAAWREAVLKRVAAERKEMHARIAGEEIRSPAEEEEEQQSAQDLDFVFDQVDWTAQNFDADRDILENAKGNSIQEFSNDS